MNFKLDYTYAKLPAWQRQILRCHYSDLRHWDVPRIQAKGLVSREAILVHYASRVAELQAISRLYSEEPF